MPAECAKESFKWKRSPDAADLAWDRKATSAQKQLCSDWSLGAMKQYESARRLVRLLRWHHRSQPEARDTLAHLFQQEVERWKTDTQHWSSVTKMLSHPSYLRIIGLAKLSTGKQIERLLLDELRSEPDHWFDALAAVTGENPVSLNQDFDESVDAWLEWGKEKGIIGN